MFEDEEFMREALKEAQKAYDQDEVPVGAVVVHETKIIGRGFNQRQTLHDPTAHAEMIAITAASEAIRDWRLSECTLYVTLEPCPMCAGAVMLARIDRVVFGADDPKGGACGSLFSIPDDPRTNHQATVVGGVLQDDCSRILRDFFVRQRAMGKK